MKWITSLPENPGKYVVETKTMLNNAKRLEAFFNGKTWNFTNQTFVRYLKED